MATNAYTIKLVRYDEDQDKTPRQLVGQVIREIQEAMDATGLIDGFFTVVQIDRIEDDAVNQILHPGTLIVNGPFPYGH